jgi:hypothetical protein
MRASPRVFIDVGGQGAGVYDLLNSWGYAFDPSKTRRTARRSWVPIDFAGSPQEPDIMLPSGELRPGPFNRRAEMWMRSRDWLDEPGGAQIPDSDSLQADACGPGYHYNANSYLLIESKEHMRDVRKVRSPDEWDAVAVADVRASRSEKDLAILSQQIGQAKHDRKTGGRDASREKAIDYFFGNMDKYVPPEANRSKVVSRDVADTINWMMPQIMRVFTASGRMFVAEPDGENDLHYADDASDGAQLRVLEREQGLRNRLCRLVGCARSWRRHRQDVLRRYADLHHGPVPREPDRR